MRLAQSLEGSWETGTQTERMQRPAPFCIFTIIWISCRPGARRHHNRLPSYKATLNHSAAQADLSYFAFVRTRCTWSCDGRRKKERQKRRLTAISAWDHDAFYCLFSVKKKRRDEEQSQTETQTKWQQPEPGGLWGASLQTMTRRTCVQQECEWRSAPVNVLIKAVWEMF